MTPSTEKKQYSAKFPDLSDVHIISESFGDTPVSPHTERRGIALVVLGLTALVIIRIKLLSLVEYARKKIKKGDKNSLS